MFGRDEKLSPVRLTAVQYVILAIFLFLAYGLWRLQVSQSDYYTAAAEKNRVRNVPILAPRGKILDRNGRTIVDNYPSFTALLRGAVLWTAGDAVRAQWEKLQMPSVSYKPKSAWKARTCRSSLRYCATRVSSPHANRATP